MNLQKDNHTHEPSQALLDFLERLKAKMEKTNTLLDDVLRLIKENAR